MNQFVKRFKATKTTTSVLGLMILETELNLASVEQLQSARHQVLKSRMSPSLKLDAMRFISRASGVR